MSLHPHQFQQLVFQWFDQHGRKHLPWQQNKTPYRVWVSEVMLQQTQVHTVIPYFEKFMHRFPHLASLADAHEDEVLHLWTGLGYYSRARNLHRTAKIIMQEFAGNFPNSADKIQKLPGIGKSTAGAIVSLAFDLPAAILDGNVKRVLARFHGIRAPINEKKSEILLWELAKNYLPNSRFADYTQAMMDLGALLCTRGKPKCDCCPLVNHCLAKQQDVVTQIPFNKKLRELPIKRATFVILQKNKQVLLQKRATTGIWGGLWSFPEISGKPNLSKIRKFCQQHFDIFVTEYQSLDFFRHTFSHYHLDIYPIMIPVKKIKKSSIESPAQIWYNPHHPEVIGLPKPTLSVMRKLL